MGVPHPHKLATHLLCVHYPHEHRVFHWPHDHPWTTEREQDLEDYARSVWNPVNGRHRRNATS